LRILYLTDGLPDYLADDLLYGLRSLLGAEVVDYPRKDVLYRNSRLRAETDRLYGRGFHCFGLEDRTIDRDVRSSRRLRPLGFPRNSAGFRGVSGT